MSKLVADLDLSAGDFDDYCPAERTGVNLMGGSVVGACLQAVFSFLAQGENRLQAGSYTRETLFFALS